MKTVPIRIFSKTDLSLIAEVDWYEDAYFTRSLTGYGQFSISINYNVTNADLFVKGAMVQFGNNDHRIGFIDNIAYPVDENGKGSQKLTITGKEAKAIFARRIIIPVSGNDYYIQDAVVETTMKNTVRDQCGLGAISVRQFPLLVIATDHGRGTQYQLQAFNTNLADHLTTAAESQSPYIGFEVYFDELNKKLVFDMIVGKDRRNSQTVNPRVCFSSEYDTLRNATITDQFSGYKNVVYVGGQGDGADKTIIKTYSGTESTGFDRMEEYLDKSSLQTTTALTNAGESELNALSQAVLTIDAQALVASQLSLYNDYDIGDLVNIKEYGKLFDAQITEAQESWAFGKYEVALTFGKQAPSITSVVTDLSAGLGQSDTSKSALGWKSAYKTYAMSADRSQQYIDIVNDVLVLSGTMTANHTLTLQAPDAAYVGRKIYSVLVTATGNFNITVTTGVSGKASVSLTATGENYIENIFVDDTGNVYKCGTNNHITYSDSSAHTFTIPAGLQTGTTFDFMVSVSSAAAITATASGSELIEGATSFVVHGAKASASVDTAICRLKKVNATTWRFVEGVIAGGSDTGTYIKLPNRSLVCISSNLTNIPYTGTVSNAFGTSSGTSYYTNITWTFPHAFKSTPIVCPGRSNKYSFRTDYPTAGPTSCVLQGIDGANAVMNCNAIAFGEWS